MDCNFQVYIPASIDDENWFVLQVDMKLLQVTVYFPNNCSPIDCGDTFCSHRKIHQILIEFESAFIWFLGAITYWQKSGRNEVESLQFSGDVVWPVTNSRIGRHSGVIVCMLLRNLVQNITLTWREGSLHDACMRFRRFMADEIYAGRFAPSNI